MRRPRLVVIAVLAVWAFGRALAEPPSTLTVRSMADVTGALAVANRQHKTLVVEFIGSGWCPYCKQLETRVLSMPEFRESVRKHFLIAVADYPPLYDRTDAKVQADPALARLMEVKAHYQVPSFPTLLSLKADGSVLSRVVGHYEDTPAAYIARLNGA